MPTTQMNFTARTLSAFAASASCAGARSAGRRSDGRSRAARDTSATRPPILLHRRVDVLEGGGLAGDGERAAGLVGRCRIAAIANGERKDRTRATRRADTGPDGSIDAIHPRHRGSILRRSAGGSRCAPARCSSRCVVFSISSVDASMDHVGSPAGGADDHGVARLKPDTTALLQLQRSPPRTSSRSSRSTCSTCRTTGSGRGDDAPRARQRADRSPSLRRPDLRRAVTRSAAS